MLQFIERARKVVPRGQLILPADVDPARIALEDGDVIRVPRASELVTVHGEVLHAHEHSSPIEPGDLLLCDVGGESPEGWASDITRTWPVSGSFSDSQRLAYEIVLEANERAIDKVRPGVSYRDVHETAKRVIVEGLVRAGVLRGEVDGLLERGAANLFFPHGVGHLLGLDVHDCAEARAQEYLDGVLRPGHVLTVEPGLYLQADDLRLPAHLRGIGIRIEDDLVVTDDGARNLSAALPRQPDAIEAWMGELLP